jgi:autotransporter-associated beta strand protein
MKRLGYVLAMLDHFMVSKSKNANKINQIMVCIWANCSGKEIIAWAISVASLLLGTGSATAANWAWSTSPNNANFNATNWTSGTTPGSATGKPSSVDSLYFGTSSQVALNNDYATDTVFNGITFNSGASAFSIGGSEIVLGGGIANNSAKLQTINFNLVLTANETVSANSGGSDIALGGVVSGAFILIKGGTGTLTLNGNNTCSSVQINGGTIKVGIGNSLPTNGTLVIAGTGGSTLDLNGTTQTPGGITISGNTGTVYITNSVGSGLIKLGGGVTQNSSGQGATISVPLDLNGTSRTFNIQNASLSVTVAAAVTNSTGTAGLTKSGVGTLILSGPNTYNGNTIVSAGTLQLNSPSLDSSAGISISNGALLNLNYSGAATVASLTTNGVSLPFGTYNSANCSPFITGTGSLQVATSASTGIWEGGASNSKWSNGTNWDNNVVPVFPIGLTFAGSANLTNTNDLSGITVASITFDAAAGAFDLTGNDITLSGGIGFNGNPSTIVTQTVNLNINFGNSTPAISTQPNGNLVLGGVLSGNAGLSKQNAGVLSLVADETYSGATTVNAGELVGFTSGSCSNSAVIVTTGATNGVEVHSTGGQWACAGLTFNSGTTYLDFNYTDLLPSVMTAPLQVNGNLALNSSVNFLIRNGKWFSVGMYPLVSYTGTLSGAVPSAPLLLPAGVTGTLVKNTNLKTIFLKVTAATSRYPDPAEVPLGAASPLSQLDMFNLGQPQCFDFRDDYLGLKTYSYFTNTISQSAGHDPKMFSEEVLTSVANQPYMAQYAAEHPEKLLLCHYNFQQILVMAQPEFTNFFPGHWIYNPGSTLTAGISATDTVLSVASTANFTTNSPPGVLTNNDVIAMIPIDAYGKRLWDQTEYVVLSSKTGSTLTVQRGMFRTAAHSFAAGTCLEVHPRTYGGDTNTAFMFNWSADCPLDSRGRNCADVFVAMMANYFQSNQPLNMVHGISSDVLFWIRGSPVSVANQNKSYTYDTDGDGLGDNGYDVQGYNRWALGVCDLIRRLRVALGPNRLLSADGTGPDVNEGLQWTRLPQYMTGMESEGLASDDDAYCSDWESNINRFRYWTAHTNYSQTLSYIVFKLPITGTELLTNEVHLSRLTAATTSILGIGMGVGSGWSLTNGVTSPSQRGYELWDSLRAGVTNQLGWLGQPKAWMRPATNAPNLFSGGASNWISSNSTITQDTNENAWLVRTKGDPYGPDSTNMTITCSNLVIPSGDLFFSFQMKAAPLMWFPTNVFRYVTVTVNGRQVNTNTADALQGVASSEGYTENTFYYRQAGPATVSITLQFEGPQDVWIKNFAMYNTTDVLARGFDHGVALANPANQPYTFNLAQLFPGRALRRIQGNWWEDPVTYNGQLVSNTVTVPALDGLLLQTANTAPVLPVQTNLTINELSLMTVTNTATDADLPAQTLTYILLAGPTNAVIDTNGIITWTPTEAQGPSTNIFTTAVTDSGTPPLSATNSFMVMVNEVNNAPAFSPITNYTINAGQSVIFTASATDSDIPTNALSFSLLSGPGQVTTNGMFSWRAPVATAGTTNQVTLQVTDNGVPPASARQSFSIFVNALQPVNLLPLNMSNNVFQMQVQGSIGPDYILQRSTNLSLWVSLVTNTPLAMPFTVMDTNISPAGFYRFLLEP